MAKNTYRILTHRSKILHTKATEELKFPLSTRNEDMIYKTIDTLRYHKGVYEKKGVAIAANQIGSMKRFFVMLDTNVEPFGRKANVICNPEILEEINEYDEDVEGCLSIIKYQCLVRRSKRILVKFQNLSGKLEKLELTDFNARVFQHEIDHLNGITMLDKQIKSIENPLLADYLKKKKQIKLENKKALEKVFKANLQSKFQKFEDF